MGIVVDEMPSSAGIPLQKAGRLVEGVHTVNLKYTEVVHITFNLPQPHFSVVLFVRIEYGG